MFVHLLCIYRAVSCDSEYTCVHNCCVNVYVCIWKHRDSALCHMWICNHRIYPPLSVLSWMFPFARSSIYHLHHLHSAAASQSVHLRRRCTSLLAFASGFTLNLIPCWMCDTLTRADCVAEAKLSTRVLSTVPGPPHKAGRVGHLHAPSSFGVWVKYLYLLWVTQF